MRTIVMTIAAVVLTAPAATASPADPTACGSPADPYPGATPANPYGICAAPETPAPKGNVASGRRHHRHH